MQGNLIWANDGGITVSIDLDKMEYGYIACYSYLYATHNMSAENWIRHSEIRNMVSELNQLSLKTGFRVTQKDIDNKLVVTTDAAMTSSFLPSSIKKYEEVIRRADQCKDIIRDTFERLKIIATSLQQADLITYIDKQISKFKPRKKGDGNQSKTITKEILLLRALRNTYSHQTQLTDFELENVEIDSSHTANFTKKLFGEKCESKDSLILKFTRFDETSTQPGNMEIHEFFDIPFAEIDDAVHSLYLILFHINKRLRNFVSLEQIQIPFNSNHLLNGQLPKNMIYSILSVIGLGQTVYNHVENQEYQRTN